MRPENNCIVIFGASGDLTRRKLIPALFHLFKNNQLPEKFAVLGVSRTELDDDTFREAMRRNLIEKEGAHGQTLEAFCTHLYYQSIDTADREDYAKLLPRLDTLHHEYETRGNTVYYLSTPPSLYGIIPECLAAHGLNDEERGWKRLIVEKPFGYDSQTAKDLDRTIHHYFHEHQIYRIDHYLGKETVQNLLVLRFSNGLFEPLWNRNYIDYIEITAAETIGVEDRGGYYDGSGAVRDMFQNHLLQILAMVAMEPPALIDADSMRDEVAKVLHSLHPLDNEHLKTHLVLAQYGKGRVGDKEVLPYRQEKGVAPDSTTETYMALRLQIDNWRWSGVPFYIRTGKYLPMRFTDSEMASRTETYLRRCWAGQAVGFRNQDFIDVVPASASKGEGLRQLVASLSESPAQDPASDLGDDSSASGVAEPPVEPIETWSIGDSWNDISMHAAADHSYALPWSPPEVVAQCDGTVSSLADLIDSLMGRPAF